MIRDWSRPTLFWRFSTLFLFSRRNIYKTGWVCTQAFKEIFTPLKWRHSQFILLVFYNKKKTKRFTKNWTLLLLLLELHVGSIRLHYNVNVSFIWYMYCKTTKVHTKQIPNLPNLEHSPQTCILFICLPSSRR